MSVLHTAPDVAAKLNYHPKTIREWCAKGVFPGANKWPNGRKTDRRRIPREDVEALERQQGNPTTVSNDRIDELTHERRNGNGGCDGVF